MHSSRARSSEGTLSRCPGFARFTFDKISLLELWFGTVIQLLGLGIGLRLAGVPPLKVVVSTRLAPWEAEVGSGGGQICSESFSYYRGG